MNYTTHQIAAEAATDILENLGITTTLKSRAITIEIIQAAIEKATESAYNRGLAQGLRVRL